MFQIIQHALTLPNDKTKLTLIFSNVSEKDILLKETLDKWAKDHKERFVLLANHCHRDLVLGSERAYSHDRFNIVYTLDKGDENWKGDTGFVTTDLIKKYLAPPTAEGKVKILVCGELISSSHHRAVYSLH